MLISPPPYRLRVVFERIWAMRTLFHLLAFLTLVAFGGVLAIKVLYGCSWRESMDIADQFLMDLLD